MGAPPCPAGLADAEDGEEIPADNRTGARQTALQALYWASSTADDPREAVRQLGIRCEHSEAVREFALALVSAVAAHQPQLDELIAASNTRWRLDRMARVDLLIMRLALAEMIHLPEVPVRVSIDEAVELAKRYSTGDSYAFVNGMLDGIARRQGLADATPARPRR